MTRRYLLLLPVALFLILSLVACGGGDTEEKTPPKGGAPAKKAPAKGAPVKPSVKFERDPNFDTAMRQTLGKTKTDPIFTDDLLTVTQFEAPGKEISDIDGLKYCRNITSINLSDNKLKNAWTLGNLIKITRLDLSGNQITSTKPLANLQKMTHLNLEGNMIKVFAPLDNLLKLEEIHMAKNKEDDLGWALPLANLKKLDIGENAIVDLSPLVGLQNLKYLRVVGNPLDEKSQNEIIPQLKKKGVEVIWPED